MPQQETGTLTEVEHPNTTLKAVTNLPVVAVSKVQREAGGSDRLEALLRYGVGVRVQVQTHQVLQLLHTQAACFPGSFLHTSPTIFTLIANVTIDMWLRT